MKYLKPNIFISSTVKDLPNEREAAKRAVEKLQAIPVMSEFTMNAVNKPSVDACIDEVKKADFYILILGGRYGWELENGISITELEYDTAYKENKPIFVYNTIYEKEPKQAKFAEKAGSQRFWKVVNNAFELEDEISKSYKQYIEEQNYAKSCSTETVYSNLLSVEFPSKLYRAELNIDRKAIIDGSKTTGKWLKKSATQFDVLISAIHQYGLKVPNDWILFENSIISFHDLSERTLGLSQLVDLGTVEEYDTCDFYNTNDDHLNVFKNLLRRCLSRKMHHLGVRWYNDEKLYVYTPQNELATRIEKWKGKVEATRTVFEAKMQKKNPEKISYCKHFAFKANFYLFDDQWYMSINPEWFISRDGSKKTYYGFEQISFLKRKEKNAQVYSHLRFIFYQLVMQKQATLFEQPFNYKFLHFKELLKEQIYPALQEKTWLNNENNKTKEDFDTVNTLFG
ncbi:hypothetical protein M2137_001148 [Parabacteroides sp. PFB2-10]|uniref:DUF4062 domain-containing protein n=1 Tax=Parabacteroides sp. PFB2-10 TaxID=1742405 RepID=UPI00247338CE|nr:DUF4062 domain-containing protein [Parabacteroides sp. PFB2-10]MDH6312378.1 hypothetical protein [Parabacteroides sp. PFB2-10]